MDFKKFLPKLGKGHNRSQTDQGTPAFEEALKYIQDLDQSKKYGDGKFDFKLTDKNVLYKYIEDIKKNSSKKMTDEEVKNIKELVEKIMGDGSISDNYQMSLINNMLMVANSGVNIGKNTTDDRTFKTGNVQEKDIPYFSQKDGFISTLIHLSHDSIPTDDNYSTRKPLSKNTVEAALKVYLATDKDVSKEEITKILNYLDDLYGKEKNIKFDDAKMAFLAGLINEAKKGSGVFSVGQSVSSPEYDFSPFYYKTHPNFEILDALDGTKDKKITGRSVIKNFVEAFIQKYNEDNQEFNLDKQTVDYLNKLADKLMQDDEISNAGELEILEDVFSAIMAGYKFTELENGKTRQFRNGLPTKGIKVKATNWQDAHREMQEIEKQWSNNKPEEYVWTKDRFEAYLQSYINNNNKNSNISEPEISYILNLLDNLYMDNNEDKKIRYDIDGLLSLVDQANKGKGF